MGLFEDHEVQYAFQLPMIDSMGPFTPEALESSTGDRAMVLDETIPDCNVVPLGKVTNWPMRTQPIPRSSARFS